MLLKQFYLAVFMIHVSENNYQFSFFTHSAKTDHEKWFWWIFFIKVSIFFFIIMYDSHVLCLYSSYLIRSSNHVNFIFHFMSLIESTKYKSSSFSTIIDCSDNTCLLIESSFKNCNRLIWNIKWTFISDSNLSLYAYELIFHLIINYFVNFQSSFFMSHFVFRFCMFK